MPMIIDTIRNKYLNFLIKAQSITLEIVSRPLNIILIKTNVKKYFTPAKLVN